MIDGNTEYKRETWHTNKKGDPEAIIVKHNEPRHAPKDERPVRLPHSLRRSHRIGSGK